MYWPALICLFFLGAPSIAHNRVARALCSRHPRNPPPIPLPRTERPSILPPARPERKMKILDGSDNFPTKYLVNDACEILGIPNVYGAILGFEGQMSVFTYKVCLRLCGGKRLRLPGDRSLFVRSSLPSLQRFKGFRRSRVASGAMECWIRLLFVGVGGGDGSRLVGFCPRNQRAWNVPFSSETCIVLRLAFVATLWTC